ncbi:hypothetical protein AAGY00_08505, partial [Staphylococcus aureus]
LIENYLTAVFLGIYVPASFGVFRCSIYYVTNYSIDEQGAQRNITINGLFHKMVKLGCLFIKK